MHRGGAKLPPARCDKTFRVQTIPDFLDAYDAFTTKSCDDWSQSFDGYVELLPLIIAFLFGSAFEDD